ncbi:MAG: DinB family protein [Terriglobales bacterium]
MITLAIAIGRPEPGEYAAFYQNYIAGVEGNDILATLDEQRRQMLLLLSGRSESDGDIRYAPGKWTVKEVIGHLCDCERIMSYRALRIARGDSTPLAGFDENSFVANAPFALQPLADLIEDFIAVRRATLSLFRNLDETGWRRRGVANDNEVTVRALAYIVAGHELHHRRMLQEKYLKEIL